MPTATRASCRCAGCIHHLDSSASFFRFVNDDGNELRPTGIGDAFRQMAIFRHVSDLKVFEFDQAEADGDLFRFLEMEITTLTRDMLMFPRQQLDGLSSSRAPLRAPRNASLGRLQFGFAMAKEPGIVDLFPGRKGAKRLEADIDADRLLRRESDDGGNLLDGENGIPAIRLAFNRARLDRPFDQARKMNLHAADLRQIELPGFLIEPEAALRIGERIVATMRAKTRKTRRLPLFDAAKEVLKSEIDAIDRLLKRLGMDSGNIRAFFLDFRQLGRLFFFADRNVIHPPGVTSFLKGRVV